MILEKEICKKVNSNIGFSKPINSKISVRKIQFKS